MRSIRGGESYDRQVAQFYSHNRPMVPEKYIKVGIFLYVLLYSICCYCGWQILARSMNAVLLHTNLLHCHTKRLVCRRKDLCFEQFILFRLCHIIRNMWSNLFRRRYSQNWRIVFQTNINITVSCSRFEYEVFALLRKVGDFRRV